jgi:hypothetical protein
MKEREIFLDVLAKSMGNERINRTILEWIRRNPKPGMYQGTEVDWIADEMPMRFGALRLLAWWYRIGPVHGDPVRP